jgi:hypothetical protein
LASKPTKSWETIRGQKPLNEKRVATYKRLMEAEQQIAEARSRRGVSKAAIDEALAVSEPNSAEVEQDDDLYLSTLARYVAALGGHLQLLAVFPEETVTVLREPNDAATSDQA